MPKAFTVQEVDDIVDAYERHENAESALHDYCSAVAKALGGDAVSEACIGGNAVHFSVVRVVPKGRDYIPYSFLIPLLTQAPEATAAGLPPL